MNDSWLSSSQNRLRWRHSAHLLDEDAQMLREREPRHVAFAPPGPYPRADDRILLSEIYDSRVAFSTHLQSSYFAAFDKTGADES